MILMYDEEDVELLRRHLGPRDDLAVLQVIVQTSPELRLLPAELAVRSSLDAKNIRRTRPLN